MNNNKKTIPEWKNSESIQKSNIKLGKMEKMEKTFFSVSNENSIHAICFIFCCMKRNNHHHQTLSLKLANVYSMSYENM